jgi:hypothetical protein
MHHKHQDGKRKWDQNQKERTEKKEAENWKRKWRAWIVEKIGKK